MNQVQSCSLRSAPLCALWRFVDLDPSAMATEFSLLSLLVLATLLSSQFKATDAKNLGICFGRLASNLPPPESALRLCDVHKIGRMRIYAPDQKIFRALNGSNVQLTVGIPNRDVHAIAADCQQAEDWFISNMEQYVDYVRFRYIVVGHDDGLNETTAKDVLQAMNNMYIVLTIHGLQDKIKIATEVGSGAVLDGNNFKNTTQSGIFMEPIIKFLASVRSPLFITNFPHIYCIEEMKDSSRTKIGPINAFSNTIDDFYSAMGKVGGQAVRVAVGGTGWPRDGGNEIENVNSAKDYLWSLASRVLSKEGTKARPGEQIEAYVYSMFDEDLREGSWKYFGLFNRDLTPVYGFPPLQ